MTPLTLRAEVTLTAANNTAYQLADTEGGELTAPAVWSGWPKLCVRTGCVGSACAPCGALDILDAGDQASSIELEGRQRRLATRSLHGLEVTRRVFVPSDGQERSDGFARFYDTIHNPGVTPATISIRLGTIEGQGELGGEGGQLRYTSNGDGSLSPEDRWLLIDDDNAAGGGEAIAVLLTGAGGRSPDRIYQGVEETGSARGLSWDYDQITIGPHASVSLLTVVVTEVAQSDALEEVRSLLRFQRSDVAFGLSDDERARVLNADLNPFNATPLADVEVVPPYSFFEGEPLQLTGQGSFDPEGFPLSYEWDLDDDGAFAEEGPESAGAVVSHVFERDGAYSVSLRVTDHQQKTDTSRVTFQVLNADPVITGVFSSAPIYEGERLDVYVEAVDPGPFDVLSYAIDWESAGAFESSEGPEASRRYPEDGQYTAMVRVRDEDGGESVSPFTFEVLNAPPVIQEVSADNPSVEGDEVTITVSASDPGGDPLLYEFDYDGDGLVDRVSAQPTVSERFTVDGVYQMRVRVSDDEGAFDELEYTLTVLNVAPVIHGVSVSANPQEGEVTTLTVVATDVGQSDQLTFEFDLDGAFGFEISQASPSLDYVFQDNVRREVSVRVSDQDGGSTVSRLFIEVANQPPRGSLRFEGAGVAEGAVATVDQDVPFEGVVEASDASALDAESLAYFWDLNNDGVYEMSSASARLMIRLPEEGLHVIRCLVRDKDLGELLLTREVSVIGRPPVIESFVLLDEPPYREGQAARFKVNALDPDPILYLFDFDGDGTFEVESERPELAYAFADEGLYEVRARAQDSSGFVESSLTLQVSNAPPSVEVDTGEVVGEGEDLEVTVTARDPGPEDLVTLTVEIQGQEQQLELMPNESRRFTVPTVDNGLISIVVNARDEDGGVAQELRAEALIQNRPPFLPPFSPPPAREGREYQLVIPAEDPAGVHDLLTFSITEPPPEVALGATTGLLLWTPSYEDYLNSPITLQFVIEDEDGGRLERALALEVLARDDDGDGIPDSYELETCEFFSPCLDPTNPDDATLDSDRDGRAALDEWREGSDPFTYEGPGVPSPLSPSGGEVVRSEGVALAVSFVTSDRPLTQGEGGEEREITLQFEVYTDEALTSLVADSGWIPQRAVNELEQSAWLVTEDLTEDLRYWWRARAKDGPAVSPWSAVERFRLNAENRPPESPSLSLPEDESVVSDFRPTLTFYPSADPDDDPLEYIVRLYRDSPMGPIPDGGGAVTTEGLDMMGALIFKPEASLQENTRYLWEVVALDDGGLESAPSERWAFTVDLENEAPSDPEIYAPLPDERVDGLRPLIQAGGSVDQEGAPVTYHFELRVYGAPEPLAVSPLEGIPARGGLAEWRPELDLIEDQKHVVSVYTSDGLSSSQLITSAFTVSAEDGAPSVPVLLEPEDGALVPEQLAVLSWGASLDPEGGEVRYQVQLCDQRARCQDSGPLVERRYDIGGLIPQQEVHLWSVTAFDEAGNTLGPSLVRRVAIAGATSAREGGCAVRADTRGHVSPWALLLLTALFARRRLA